MQSNGGNTHNIIIKDIFVVVKLNHRGRSMCCRMFTTLVNLLWNEINL